ncbi:alpha/beta fold hydrolase [Nocardia brasiliensis]|uniref:alpha/beta hydrolase family protein n=1 Tax=Nocardia brasiliensis TaxID=37326 RepID=UPI001894B075|nr:alpha/beta fold hydrolase [Nocardia brasiliensis]MBF6131052.1 alpha/beta fold hydrolase [Nocardia brasiliensis]MBF6542642.1 alpha/beta fold hydrolase [Nocardia brasiliensis]
MIPAAEATTETVRAADGATTEVRMYRQAADPSAPVVICMPAMATPAASYVPLAESLFQAGFQVVLGELRGQGTSSVRLRRGVRYGYHEIVTLDYPALFEAVTVAFPEAPRYLLGHSLGGQLGALYLGQQPHRAAGAILIGAPSCHYRGWPFPRNLGIFAAAHLAVGIGSVAGYFPGRRLGILGNDSTGLMRDFAAQIRSGRYRVPSSPLDFESDLSRITQPILVVTIEGDTMATAHGVRALSEKLTHAAITRVDLGFGDATHRNPHYAWIRDNAGLVDRVRTFIASGA